MEFELTREQKMIVKNVKAFMRGEIAPVADELDRECHLPGGIWQTFGDLGLLGLGIPEEYGGINMMMTGLDTERVAVAGLALGIGETALELGLNYTKSRHQFDRPICDFQMVKAKLANIYTEIEAARGLI